MSEKPKTRALLEARIAELEASNKDRLEVNGRLRQRCDEAERREKETRAHFDDLKKRLASSEAENSRMRGYIARVQEDDVVREDLVHTGDPAGEQLLVPKRKPTLFGEPFPYMVENGHAATELFRRESERHRPPPKHWVNY